MGFSFIKQTLTKTEQSVNRKFTNPMLSIILFQLTAFSVCFWCSQPILRSFEGEKLFCFFVFKYGCLNFKTAQLKIFYEKKFNLAQRGSTGIFLL